MSHLHDSSFTVREPAWHNLQDHVLDTWPEDWDEARKFAGLEWEPELAPVHVERVALTDDGVTTTYESIDSHRAVLRNDTGAVLGVVSDQFELITHKAMGEIIETILGQPNVKFETAGSLKGGAMVWALVYLDEPVQIAGDDSATYPFLAVLNAHDGSAACKVIYTPIRIVCWNTYSLASLMAERTGHQFVFRHVAGVNERMEEARIALSGLRDQTKQLVEIAEDLTKLNYSDERVSWFLSEFIPEPVTGASPRRMANVERARSVFLDIYNGVTCDAHRGTGLGVLDAAVEFIDHARAYRSVDSYVGRTLLRPEPEKARALKLVREIAEMRN